MATTLIRLQQRRNTAATWTASNEVLLAGEPGYETDTGKFKIGDGTLGWNALRYYQSGGGVDVRDYGAKVDGTTDDRAALAAAYTAAATSPAKTVTVPTGTMLIKSTATPLIPPAGVTLRGEGPNRTVIAADTATTGAYAELFNFNNPDVTIEQLTIRRASDHPSVLLVHGATANVTIRDVVLDGRRSIYATNFCHGFQIGRHTGTGTNLTVTRAKLTDLTFGLFQANASTGTVDGVTFRDCTFTANTSTDLEFNAPASTMTRVRVENCNFTGSTATAAGSGFAVGLAHVVDAVIRDCTITGTYNNEAIHIEDWAADVTVTGCKISSGGLIRGAVVQIIGGARQIRIIGNSFDTTGNTTSVYVINCLAGGAGTTVGGRPSIAPSQVQVADNQFNLTGTNPGVYLEVVPYASIIDNVFNGPGTVSSGVYAGAFCYAIRAFNASGTIIRGNVFRKMTYGIYPATDGQATFTAGTVIAGNIFESCLLGAGISNIAATTVTGNQFTGCQNPMILSHGSYADGNVTVTDNHANACTNPFGIYGTVTVTANGTAAVGTGVTLAVTSLRNVVPDGTTITFTGGGTFTTVGPSGVDARNVTGNLTGAAIASGETGFGYIPYSYNPGTFNRTLANNTDSFYTAAGSGIRSVTTGANYRIDGHEDVVYVFSTGITVTLPPAAYYTGQGFRVKNTSTGTVTVAAAAGLVVDSGTLASRASARYVSDGTNWNTL